MHSDLKIGLFCGMVVVVAAILYLAAHPSLSPKRLMPRKAEAQPAEEVNAAPHSPEPAQIASTEVRPSGDPNLIDWTVYEQTERAQTERFHIIEKNQTLSDVARKYYGAPSKWPKIYNANRSTIENPNSVRPGTKIIIPD